MRKPAELLLVPMIDIFTVLVTFLLMTAVFSRITIVELDLPSAADGPAVTEPEFRLEVILREEGFELTNGSAVIAAIPKVGGKYDLKALSELALSLKRDHPGRGRRVGAARAAGRVRRPHPGDGCDPQRREAGNRRCDACRPAGGWHALTRPFSLDDARPERVALFTDIALGDAP